MSNYVNTSALVYVFTPNFLFSIAKQASLSRCFILQRLKND